MPGGGLVRITSGYGIMQVGTGLILPALLLYWHQGRHFLLPTAGALISAVSVAALVTLLVIGQVLDRVGTRPVLVLSQCLGALGIMGFVWAPGLTGTLLAAVLYGVSAIASWTALATALALAGGDSRMFGVNYLVGNLGLGIGSVLGGIALRAPLADSFPPLAGIAAALYLINAGVVATGRSPAPGPNPPGSSTIRGERAPRIGSHRVLLEITVINFLLVLAAWGQLTSGWPIWIAGPLHLPPNIASWAFSANCLVIAALQWPLVGLLTRISQPRAAAAGAVLFAAATAGILWARQTGPVPALALVFLSAGVLGVGEALLSPTLPVLVNRIAPAAQKGRYTAMFNLSWPLGNILGPALSSWTLARGYGQELWAGAILLCLLAAAACLHLEPNRLSRRGCLD
ncbi:MAG: MFS transporter [Thermaerobacter sp.]|nr:MFS transporter [Thermaerobacter sp.]